MMMAGFHPKKDQEAFEKLDRSRVGVLVGTGIGGMSVFANNVETQARGSDDDRHCPVTVLS